MSEQNVYDNEVFFKEYFKLRQNADSANNLEEKPAIFVMIGDVRGKNILDLGCGYGENCRAFSDMGAKSVTGIDISKKMLEIAAKENSAPNATYFNMPMEEISGLTQKFDLVVSSLAIHYVQDYAGLAGRVYSLLNDGGLFVFSQEHPLTTAPIGGAEWVRNADGEIDHYRLTDYMRTGERSVKWLIDGVIKYHRTFSELINGLVTAGFRIEEVREPVSSPEVMRRLPRLKKELHKPNFLIIKVRK